MKLTRIFTSSIIVLLFFNNLFAQEVERVKKEEGFGGPDQVERQLEEDHEPKRSIFELGFLSPYFVFKDTLQNKSGFGYGLDYSAAYFKANNSLANEEAGSGMLRFYSSWDLINRNKANSGALIFKIEHRHKYGAIPPKSLGFELGYVGIIDPPFNNDGFRLTNLYWRQRFLGDKISLTIGLLDATDYLDIYALTSPWLHFTNFAFSTGSQTIYIPNDANLGIAVGVYLTDHIYAIAGINDAGSDPTKPLKSFETFFTNNDYFKSVEAGWVSSKERHFFDNIHLTYWHSDGSDVTASLAGWGLAFSGTWFIQDKFMPFLRGGYAKDGGTLLQKSVAAGLGYYPVSEGNLLGIALGWGEINETTWGANLNDQMTFEVFYRIQILSRLAITPDLQYLINPALNADASSIFLWGIRGRLAL
jgi:porin